MFVITGATGHIGSRTAGILLEQGHKVRVIGRSDERLQPLVERGAEGAVGDLRDREFLRGAMRGATALFAMIPPNHTARNFRSFQNEVGASIAAAIEAAGVSRVVNLSSQGAELTSGTGPILGLRDQEERLNDLNGLSLVHLRPTYFMENLLMSIPLIHQFGCAASAVRGDLPLAMIATCDVAVRTAAELQKRPSPGRRVVDLLGERDLPLAEATAVVGRAIGKPRLKYRHLPYRAAEAGMVAMGISPNAARLFTEMSRALNQGRFAVGLLRTPENTTPTSIEQFAEVFAAAYAAVYPHQAA
jgi:uncharacterized protein YbjT (DUF2867 family)